MSNKEKPIKCYSYVHTANVWNVFVRIFLNEIFSQPQNKFKKNKLFCCCSNFDKNPFEGNSFSAFQFSIDLIYFDKIFFISVQIKILCTC